MTDTSTEWLKSRLNSYAYTLNNIKEPVTMALWRHSQTHRQRL